MRSIEILLLFAPALILCSGCSSPTDPRADGAGDAPLIEPAGAVAHKQDPRVAALFQLAFGGPPPFEIKAPLNSREGVYYYMPVHVLSSGRTEILISEATTSDCHGCFGKLAIHYFSRAKGNREVLGSWFDLVEGDGWGRPPQWLIRTDLLSSPVLEIRNAFGNNGSNCEWLSLIELTPAVPIVRLPPIVAGYDNRGARDETLHMPEKYWQSSTASVNTRNRDGFAVVYKGSRPGIVTYSKVHGDFVADRPPPIDRCRST
jgi:hypothetical protein